MKAGLVISLFVFSMIALPAMSWAQWAFDGNPLCTAAAEQVFPTIVSDGAGGAIVTWRDNRSVNSAYDIYVQRVNASGVALWTVNGVALSTAASWQDFPQIVSDGAGGAIVAWNDLRNSNWDIYAQRINASGVVQWAVNGVALCTAANVQDSAALVSDGAGGAIVTWQDSRSGNYDVYAQRVNASGAVQWAANGIVLGTAAFNQQVPSIVADGAGGAIVTWHDFRNGSDWDIYAQRVGASGVVQWTANGVALCTAGFDQTYPRIASDGAAGGIVTWQDARSGSGSDIFAQRVNASGAVQWEVDGVVVCYATHQEFSPLIVSDGAGGAIIAWEDHRISFPDVYAQRVTSFGGMQWAADGVSLCDGDVHNHSMVSDGAGGAIVTWWDGRSGINYDIYAQRVKASGVVPWAPNGVVLAVATQDQAYPTIVSNGPGGAIVTWLDNRNGYSDIYAQRVEAHGDWGYPEPTITLVADIRGDQGGFVKVNWKASDRDIYDEQLITRYSIWRATDAAAALLAKSQGTVVRNPSEINAGFKGRAVWTQHTPTTDYYWEWVGNQDAHYRAAYTFSADTRADSTSQGTANTYFMVSAHTSDDFVFFDSNSLSGHSVDNLAPPAPLFLTAQRVAADVHLKWNRVRVADLKKYTVYRKTASGVTPIPANFLADGTDTVLTDSAAPAGALYYIVTARDVHENQSGASNEANVGATTNAGNLPPVTALAVLQNYPNPFTGTTELQIGLPRAGAITVGVYDVAGKRVREFVLNGTRGWQSVALAGIDGNGRPLASGVYFYRVRVKNETVTRKMLIMR